MKLIEKIIHADREIAGSMAKNRLSFQISYGIKLIMDFYDTDFILIMDYIEDIAILNNSESPDLIRLYQVKTKNTASSLSLTTVVSEQWINKLYKNAMQFGEYFSEGHLVCNSDIMNGRTPAFMNLKNCLNNPHSVIISNKFKKAIADDMKIAEDDVDLSKFFIVRSQLTVDKFGQFA